MWGFWGLKVGLDVGFFKLGVEVVFSRMGGREGKGTEGQVMLTKRRRDNPRSSGLGA